MSKNTSNPLLKPYQKTLETGRRMRLWILSDLHLEQSSWQPSFGVEADAVVLAGDLHNPLCRSIEWIARQRDTGAFKNMEVVLIPGNHEFYHVDIDDALAEGRRLAQGVGIHLLDGDQAIIGGVRFLGCTLWTDYCLSGDQRLGMITAELGLNDHRCIRKGNGTFMPRDALARHLEGKAWLERELAKPHDGKTVVVTHHCVSRRSVHDRWRNDVISAAFSSNLDALVGSSNADLWVHGHTHDSFDYQIGRTRVVCNPRGYGSENQFFDPKLVVEIGGDRHDD